MGACIIGTGSCLPENVFTNQHMSKLVDTSDEWIKTRTGIESRRLALGKTTTDLAIGAAKAAIEDAGIDGDEIGMVIVATLTPHTKSPTTASFVQGAIGAVSAVAFDLNAACSGFVYAVSTAAAFIPQYKTILVVGAEKMSTVVDWSDRGTCVLFGDGAGAVVLRENPDSCFFSLLKSFPDLEGVIRVGCRSTFHPDDCLLSEDGFVHMNGSKVFRFASLAMCNVIEELLEKSGVAPSQISFIVPHQANVKIINLAMSKLSFSPESYVLNINKYGNTSAASVPIALDELAKSGKLKVHDKIILVAFGGGLTAGAVIAEWANART